ncbi:hypothetical protein EBS40_09020 [bacterium]|nr:hypothetical protein [bacterium]NDG19466.1 hypothetical protein [Betaproteobacteria bacterium]
MAKSGQRKGGSGAGGVRVERSTKNDVTLVGAESLSTIADPVLRKDIQSAISRFASIFGGVSERVIKIADFQVLPSDFHGALAVQYEGGKSQNYIRGIYLNKDFWTDKKTVNRRIKEWYDMGWFVRTSNPTRHIVMHELAHAKWSRLKSSRSARNARKEVTKLYRQWRRKERPGWGDYAKKNVDEFFAEGLSKHALGSGDRYTRRLVKILKENNL